MDERFRKLLEESDRLFTEKRTLDNLHQEIADQFYPEMAEFTRTRDLGEDYASHLTTSYPIIARRTLGDAVSALLRPTSLNHVSPGVWFNLRMGDEKRETLKVKRWLAYATGVCRRAMYDRQSNFVRATKQADHTFVTFGQAPLSYRLNRMRDTIVFNHWHLRDMAWTEDGSGEIDTIHRKWTPTAAQAIWEFGDGVSPRVEEKMKDNPGSKINCRHIVMRSERYNVRRWRRPWVSIWLDVDHDHIMQEIELEYPIYIIPRWVTVPGSQYGISPAVIAALPDARLIQAMSLTLLEASEKLADPPMAATQEAVRSDVQLYAGGITWIDAAYDERMGEALRPIYQPTAGQSLAGAMQMRIDVKDMIDKAFYLHSLSLPPSDAREMTAFEVGQRITEWIRNATPIFEPIEFEYNGRLCDGVFEMLMRNGAFGPIEDIPEELRREEVKFQFESPLHESSERKKGQTFMEAKAALAQAADIEPDAAFILDAKRTLRDVMLSVGCPPTWIRDEEEVKAMQKAAEQQQNAMQAVEGATAGAQIAQALGGAAKDFSAANAQSATAAGQQ